MKPNKKEPKSMKAACDSVKNDALVSKLLFFKQFIMIALVIQLSTLVIQAGLNIHASFAAGASVSLSGIVINLCTAIISLIAYIVTNFEIKKLPSAK